MRNINISVFCLVKPSSMELKMFTIVIMEDSAENLHLLHHENYILSVVCMSLILCQNNRVESVYKFHLPWHESCRVF